ncbi:DUF6106 family protein [Vallitaleaceae bacterium 9-2]|mgnify:CR=1 FL=1
MAYNDVFKEQLVKRENNGKDMMKKIGIIAGAIVLVFIASMIPIITGLGLLLPLIVLIGWVAIVLVRRLNLEYEYIFTNGELDIDRIFNKSKRKRAISIEVRSIHVMIHAKHPDYKQETSNVQKVLDFSSGVESDQLYAAILDHEGKRTMLLMEPNDTLIDGIKMYIPRKVKK